MASHQPFHWACALLAGWLCLCMPMPVLAQAQHAQAEAVDPAVLQQVRQLALDAAAAVSQATPGARVEIELGQLNPRLRLAPCTQVEPYLPTGTKLWGRTRIGLRCIAGERRWNVFIPITVKIHGLSLVTTTGLSAGTVLLPEHLQHAEVDLAGGNGAIRQPQAALGRALARNLAAGAALHQGDLRLRQYFSAGDTVRVDAVGAGFAVSGEGQALSHGLEGRPVRVRTENGRVVTGLAVDTRRVEVAL
jgi:flagella basal body P-ring formation protein FlgA